jgi:glycosyltransferase involved in cell wall biosynthesis
VAIVQADVEQPLLTVAITCYNAEDTIGRAVDCALAQTWTPREIIIVDDGSTDESAELLRGFERTHDEIRVIRHDSNRGVAEARNTLLAHANGAFIAFFDDDDQSASNRLEEQYRKLSEYELNHPGAIVLCYSNRVVTRTGERHRAFERFGIGRQPPEPSASIVADYVLGLFRDDRRHSWGMLGSGTLMARTQDLRGLDGFDPRFRRCAERDLAVRAALDGAHFISVDASLVTQYLTPTADKGGNSDLRYRLELVKKHRAYLREKGCYAGAWCNMHARFYNGWHWSWRLWYLAALVCFPWPVSRERLRHSSLLERLHLLPARPGA